MKKSNMLFVISIIAVILCGAVTNQSQDLSKISGVWEGTLTAGGMELKIVFHFDSGEKVTAKMDSPNQNAYGIPVDEVIINANKIRLNIKSISGFYEGQFDPDKNIITGTWNQGGGVFELDLNKLIESPKQEQKNYLSLWQGTLQISAVELRLIIKIFENEDKSIGAYLDSPDQGAQNIPVNTITINSDSLNFTMPDINGSYTGKFNNDKLVYEGIWTQGGMSLPLDFKQIEKIEEPKRPQTPQGPFPYKIEEVSIDNESAGIKLAGTFTYPNTGGTFPAVILVSGSGPQDRDETIFNHKPFLVIADYLTRNGIAVLRYDDRGIGKSSGDFSAATSLDFTSDVLAAVEYLKTRNEVDKNKLGIAGHSEGGIIAPMAASQTDDVKFIILLAGPGVPGAEVIKVQTKLILEVMGTASEDVEKAVELNGKIYDIILSESDDTKAKEKIMAEYNIYYNSLSEEQKQEPGISPDMFGSSISQLLSPWFRFFLAYDPGPTLEEIKIPVLALNGEKDLQVEPKQNLKAIADALTSAGNKNFKTIELPGLNHLFQHSGNGAISDYGKIEETFAPEALKLMSDWILSDVK